MIYHLKVPGFDGHRFEWHPETRRLFVVRVGVRPEQAEWLCEKVESVGAAQQLCIVYCLGIREGSPPAFRERVAAPAPTLRPPARVVIPASVAPQGP